MKWKEKKKLCKCGKPRRDGQRICKECHAAYMREWRKQRVYVRKDERAA